MSGVNVHSEILAEDPVSALGGFGEQVVQISGRLSGRWTRR